MIFDLSNSQREIWGSSCQHHTVLMLAELTPLFTPFNMNGKVVCCVRLMKAAVVCHSWYGASG
jgi:hypothetical protein